MKIGDRVRTKQLDPRYYATGAAEALSGLVGTVEDDLGPTKRDIQYLVRFDEPAPSWWKHQRQLEAFRFGDYELEALT